MTAAQREQLQRLRVGFQVSVCVYPGEGKVSGTVVGISSSPRAEVTVALSAWVTVVVHLDHVADSDLPIVTVLA